MLLLKGEYMPLSIYIYIETFVGLLLVVTRNNLYYEKFYAFLDMRRNRIGLITALENI